MKTRSIRRQLGKEQFQLIKQKNGLIQANDLNLFYMGNPLPEYVEQLHDLDNKIFALVTLRAALKLQNTSN